MSQINPYQSPIAANKLPESLPPDLARVVRNIRAICILYVAFGIIAVVAGLVVVVDPKNQKDFSPAAGWAMFIGGIAGTASAIGVLRKKAWGIPFCQVVSAIYLIGFPIGTILGGFFLLNIGKVKREFRSPKSPPNHLAT